LLLALEEFRSLGIQFISYQGRPQPTTDRLDARRRLRDGPRKASERVS
jgi:hypothetical protein